MSCLAGGCCDCGDPDAWDPKGFCPLHGKDEVVLLNQGLEKRARGIVDCCVGYLSEVAGSVEGGYKRANFGSGKRKFGRAYSAMVTNSEREEVGGGGEEGGGGGMQVTAVGRNVQRASAFEGDERDYNENERAVEQGTAAMDISSRSSTSLERMEDESTDAQNDADMENDAVNMAGATSSLRIPTPTPTSMPSAVVLPERSRSSSEQSVSECKFDPAAASTSKSRTTLNTSQSSSSTSGQNEESFNPEAASTSKSQSSPKKRPITANMTPAHHLGLLGSQQEGLFLLLHADDVHKPLEVTTALRTLYYSYPFHTERNLDSISSKIAHLFQQDIGDLIVWGTQELMDELGPVLSSCWKDGDATACTRFGALILEKAKILTTFGMVVSIKTRGELCREIRCAAVLEFMNLMSGSCDPLCRLVSVGLGAKEKEEEDDGDGDARMKDDQVGVEVVKDAVSESEDGSSSSGHLITMLQSDLKLPRKIAKSWHDLLLILLAVPNFKATLANAYVDTYGLVTAEYAHGIGIFEKSSYTLSVQFLNRVAYVEDLVRERDLLGTLVRSLFETLSVAIKTKQDSMHDSINALSRLGNPNRSAAWTINMIHDVIDDYLNPLGSRRGLLVREERSEAGQGTRARLNPVLDPLHSVLSNRRYGPCISDLKCVLNVPGVARLFSSIPTKLNESSPPHPFQKPCLLDAWMATLSLAQNMDGQRWRRAAEGHVEQEPRDWVGAFNAGISIGSLFERLLSWDGEYSMSDDFYQLGLSLFLCLLTILLLHIDNDDEIDSTLFREFKMSNTFLSAVELTQYILTRGIDAWQSSEALSSAPTANGPIPEYNCPTCLPMSSVAADHNAPIAMKALPVAQSQLWSFHLPLHRFVASCLREVARRPYQRENGQVGGIQELVVSLKEKEDARKLHRIYSGLLEYPIVVVSRNSQIRSDLWLVRRLSYTM